MQKIKYMILTLGLLAGFGLATVPAGVGAFSTLPSVCDSKTGSAPDSAICKNWGDGKGKDQAKDFVKTLVNTLLYILGAVSVIIIIMSGVFFVTSMGTSESIKKARETLQYAVIGLVVAILAYAIVNFVLTVFKI